jgi:hypothetical protein
MISTTLRAELALSGTDEVPVLSVAQVVVLAISVITDRAAQHLAASLHSLANIAFLLVAVIQARPTCCDESYLDSVKIA